MTTFQKNQHNRHHCTKYSEANARQDNVADEGMEATWPYIRRLARRSEEIGFDLTLIAELNLNDIISNRGLRSGLVGTPEQVTAQVLKFDRAAVELL